MIKVTLKAQEWERRLPQTSVYAHGKRAGQTLVIETEEKLQETINLAMPRFFDKNFETFQEFISWWGFERSSYEVEFDQIEFPPLEKLLQMCQEETAPEDAAVLGNNSFNLPILGGAKGDEAKFKNLCNFFLFHASPLEKIAILCDRSFRTTFEAELKKEAYSAPYEFYYKSNSGVLCWNNLNREVTEIDRKAVLTHWSTYHDHNSGLPPYMPKKSPYGVEKWTNLSIITRAIAFLVTGGRYFLSGGINEAPYNVGSALYLPQGYGKQALCPEGLEVIAEETFSSPYLRKKECDWESLPELPLSWLNKNSIWIGCYECVSNLPSSGIYKNSETGIIIVR